MPTVLKYPSHICEILKMSERCVHLTEREGCGQGAVQTSRRGLVLRARPLRVLLLRGGCVHAADWMGVRGRESSSSEVGGAKWGKDGGRKKDEEG